MTVLGPGGDLFQRAGRRRRDVRGLPARAAPRHCGGDRSSRTVDGRLFDRQRPDLARGRRRVSAPLRTVAAPTRRLPVLSARVGTLGVAGGLAGAARGLDPDAGRVDAAPMAVHRPRAGRAGRPRRGPRGLHVRARPSSPERGRTRPRSTPNRRPTTSGPTRRAFAMPANFARHEPGAARPGRPRQGAGQDRPGYGRQQAKADADKAKADRPTVGTP